MAYADVEYRCFVGGLNWATDEQVLERAFSPYGEILGSKIINDRETGRSRGFGFVTFSNEQSMRDAIEGMNGQDLDGHNITVNEAQSRGGGGGSYSRGGGSGGYGGGGRRESGGGYSRGGRYGGSWRDRGYGSDGVGGGYSRGGGGGGYGGDGRRESGGGYSSGGGYGGSWRDRGYGGGGSRDPRNPDRSSDRSLAISPPARGQGTAFPQNVPSEEVWPEERLRDKSMAAIKEYYSARDKKEVELCVKELDSPSFHPSMVSLWVVDSLERKDMERDLLAKLLIYLSKSGDGVLSQAQLIKGFESVLTTLEDAINDAPRAPEFLGHIFAKVITENVIPLREIGLLIHKGGEEPGHLLEVGLAADVLGSTLEIIKFEKGDSVFNEIWASSTLRFEDFRPPDPYRSRKLEKFILGDV
ncbi:eukaryotic translation initiation factor 4G-like isoform X2 [Juglans regia]|uniref:Eukaryotic translation initiation factor 4G-like isoform X2 n=1 Tax=Juglans regia TaxID=51240 RepID=A0A6P9ET12_JUGRE|nr:eukaryotic translation initiation factor 4G-like isoform X2 [Juglans regia]